MSVTITKDQIGDIYRRYAYDWTVAIAIDGAAPDISGDVVALILKTQVVPGADDSDAALYKEADVVTAGEDGKATFSLLSTDTDISAGKYWLEIRWTRPNKPMRLLTKIIEVFDPVFNETE